jgi:hypothetical protein
MMKDARKAVCPQRHTAYDENTAEPCSMYVLELSGSAAIRIRRVRRGTV